jgi:predicted nucleic acid-binding protein
VKRLDPVIALDTSVIVPALLGWHEHHDACLLALMRILSSERGCVLPFPALLESYAVMTRLPPPHRLAPEDALLLLHRTFFNRCRLTSLPNENGWQFMATLAERAIAGGRTYDALIMACAQLGGAHQVLTLNRRHFEGLAPEIGIEQP